MREISFLGNIFGLHGKYSMFYSSTGNIIHLKIFSYQVRKGEETDWSDASTVATGQNSTVYSVQGLHPFSVYSFKVAAVNGVGLSRESDQSYYMITLREVSWDWWTAVT